MGMYTGIQIDVLLKASTPENVLEALRTMTLVTDWDRRSTERLCDHPLFDTDRWQSVLCCQSAYFPKCEKEQGPRAERLTQKPDGCWRLKASASLKNYGGEIQKFLDWIAPYVDERQTEEVGRYRYEETNNSTFFSFDRGSVSERTETENKEDWEY